MKFIPQRSARLGFMAEAIREAGYSDDLARSIARLVPDIIVFNAVFVKPRPVWLEVINNRHCYLKIDDKLIYIGRPLELTDNGFVNAHPSYANRPPIEVLFLRTDEALHFDPAPLIQEAATKYLVTHRWYNEATTRTCIDLGASLKEFTEAA